MRFLSIMLSLLAAILVSTCEFWPRDLRSKALFACASAKASEDKLVSLDRLRWKYRVLLIGKDGGVKSRSSDLDLEATFGLIDQMPMRREEIRRKRVDQNGKTMGARNIVMTPTRTVRGTPMRTKSMKVYLPGP